MTDAALPVPAAGHHDILRRLLVSADAMRLARAPKVLRICYSFEVLRVAAELIATGVIDHEPGLDGSVVRLIGDPVDIECPAPCVGVTVSLRRLGALPNLAAGDDAFNGALKDALVQIFNIVHGTLRTINENAKRTKRA